MEKQNKSAFQRVLAFALTLIMVVGMLPMNVIALEPSDRAKVTPIGGGVAVDDGNGNITVTVTEAALDWREATTEHGEGWWVGICVNAPESMTAEELAQATYTVDGGLPEFFVTKSGGESYVQFWIPVTQEFLAAGVAETDLYEFNWNGLGDNNQTVTLTVVPSDSIVLKPKAPDPELEPETVTLTVSKTGNGTVEVNGSEAGDTVTVLKDTAVPVKVTPAAGYKIASLTVGGVPKTVENDYSDTVTFAEGASIVVTFEAIVYSITVTAGEGGTVAVTDAEQNPVTTAGYGDKVTVSVSAAAGYRIGSVKIGTDDQEITDPAPYQAEITVDQDINIEVAFVKVYTVTVTYDENGSVKVDGNDIATGGSVTVDEGDGNISITALPNEGYVVSLVQINSESAELTANNIYELAKNQNYTIEITFAVATFSIDVETPQNGEVTANVATVEYGGEAEITITPAAGHVVDTVTVNGIETTALRVLNDDQYALMISGITEDQNVQVSFKTVPNASETAADLTATGDMVRTDGYQAVYKNVAGGATVLKTVRDGIRVTLADGTVLGGRDLRQIVAAASVEVTKIELFYQDDHEAYPCWHRVADVTDENKLHLVIDTQILLEVTLSDPDITGGEKNYYCNDFTVNVEVTENEPGAGIQLVEYYIYRGADTGEATTLYEYVDGEAILDAMTDLSFAVDAESNNGEDLQIVVAVKDRAENIATFHTVVHINHVQAAVVFDNDGKQPANNGKYYRESREAVITITDDPDKFDPNGVRLNLAATNAQGQPVENAYTIGEWVSEGNQHTARVVFSADANYIWQSVTYRNKIGTELKTEDLTVEDSFGTPGLFAVDTTAPTGRVYIDENFWGELLETITFGLYTNTSFTVTGTGKDDTSPVKLQYYVDDAAKTDALSETELDGVEFSDMPDQGITVDTEAAFVVYLKISDYAGNYTYVSSNGAIVDQTPPTAKLDPLNAAKTEEADGETVYVYNKSAGENVAIELNVSDEGGSGIASVSYWIEKDGIPGETTTWTNLEDVPPQILVNTAENNSGSVVVHVEVFDKAGNPGDTSAALAIDITPPEVTLDPLNAAKTEEVNGETVYVYNKSAGENVAIELNVSDGGDAGIEKVEYWIVKDGIPGDTTTWTSLEDVPAQLLVSTKDINSNVVVHVRVTDNAGNEEEDFVNLNIDTTPPSITINLDRELEEYSSGYSKYKAEITITECEDDLDIEDFISIEVRKNDEDGERITVENPAGDYYTIESGYDQDNKEYVATINFIKDGYYEYSVAHIPDKADNLGSITWIHEGYGTYRENGDIFSLDMTPPEGTVNWPDGKSSTALVEQSDFSFVYYNGNVNVTFEGDKTDIAGLAYVEYYLSDSVGPLSKERLEALDATAWSKVGAWPLLLETDQRVTVYLKLVDNYGRVTYISTNGMILDDTLPEVVDITAEGNMTNGFYTGDVTVQVQVKDSAENGFASGFDKAEDFTVEITNSNGNPMTVPPITWNQAADGSVWTGTFVLKTQDGFDNNEFTVAVTAKDQAGNEAVPMSNTLKIDAKAPAVTVTYVNRGNHNNGHYTGEREAMITVEERNFKPEEIKIVITNAYGEIPKISAWTKGDGTGGNSTYTATVKFVTDGEYTLDVVSVKDAAGNQGNGVKGETFAIDNTAPTITVAYDNNDARNDRYFKEHRVATVTIKEQNFDENRVVITQTAAQGGVTPNVAWAHNGDTHVATLTYSADGVYTFDITATDMAGNASGEAVFNGAAAKDFVIDTTYEDMVTIGGVENGKAYGYGQTPIPVVRIEDINLDEYNIKLTGIQKGKTTDLTDEVYALLNAGAQEVSGTFDIFQVVQDLDGIYTLSVYGLDKAGNEDREEVTFTVNRFGSVYVYNDYLMGLIANGGAYTTAVTDDLVITEYNADKLLEGSLVIEITRDGRPVENVIFEATPEINDTVAVGESGWYQYRYTISKDNFTSDGVYKITISSKDAAGNAAENNNYEGMAITFRVDTTAPEITSIVGLEEAIINETEVTVKYTAYDTLGLKSVQVYVDGVMVDEITDFSADLSNYTGSFSLAEKNAVQHVRIVVEDLAGNVTDTDSEYFVSAYEFNEDVTVSTNIFVRWYANKGLFWGSIGGVLAAAGILIFLLAKKRKRA